MSRRASRPVTRAARLARAGGATLMAVLLAVLTGCAPATDADAPPPRTLSVFAAASLTQVFTELADKFESEQAGVTVQLNFTGSSTLVEQILEGAPADVFASADEANMAKLTAEGLAAGAPEAFATNTLQIAVPAGNPGRVSGFDDLADPELRIVVCAVEVPCGAATATVEQAAGVQLAPDSEEQSVTDVLAKVTSGEADAGVVYVTDVIAAGDAVEPVDIADADAAVNRYPIAVVDGAPEAGLARQWVDLVLGDAGRRALDAAGFGAP